MNAFLPGTKIECDLSSPDNAKTTLSNIFCGGGLVLSQVSHLIGCEAYTVQNWIKRGFCSSPISKKYSKRQFCRLVTINMLKDSLSIPHIVSLLTYINGHLDDESDDSINDDELYLYFISLIIKLGRKHLSDESIDSAAREIIADFQADDKTRLARVLKIMAIAYFSVQLKQKAEGLISDIS